MTIDPVCGTWIVEKKAKAATFYAGRIFYFCSEKDRDRFEADPEAYASKVKSGALRIGIMGAASGYFPPGVVEAARELGAAAARKKLVVVTGAAPGLPWESARGAQAEGGLSIGISPALSLDEHVNFYKSPADHFDVMIYTGSGLMGREIVNIRSSDMVVIINGHSGTLGEFAIAYDEGKLIGVLEGSGGIAAMVPQLVEVIDKDTGSFLVYDRDPATLIDRLIEEYVGRHFKHPSVFVQNDYEKKGGVRREDVGAG
ncbi:MAG: SLOG cluster 4 domain-containing protein [Thermoleophilia bacterium]